MRKIALTFITAALFTPGITMGDSYEEPRSHTTWISAADPRHYGFPIDGASVLPGMPFYQSLRAYWESHQGALPEDHAASPFANIILPKAGLVLSLASGEGQEIGGVEGGKQASSESYYDYDIDAFMESLSLLLDSVIPDEIKQEVYKRDAGY